MENQLDSVTEKPTCFLRLQGLACDWSKHNKHSRNIFSVHGFLRLSVNVADEFKEIQDGRSKVADPRWRTPKRSFYL